MNARRTLCAAVAVKSPSSRWNVVWDVYGLYRRAQQCLTDTPERYAEVHPTLFVPWLQNRVYVRGINLVVQKRYRLQQSNGVAGPPQAVGLYYFRQRILGHKLHLSSSSRYDSINKTSMWFSGSLTHRTCLS